jgi:predicted aspartyl protease
VTGVVDAAWRSLLTISLQNPVNGRAESFDAWVDTGFNGDLVLPLAQVTSLDLPAGYSIRAILYRLVLIHNNQMLSTQRKPVRPRTMAG